MCSTSRRSGCTSATTRGCSTTLKRLRDLGNTVIVVEHDEEAIRTADWLVDMGPGAGVHGGHLVAEGTPDEVMRQPGQHHRPIPDRHAPDRGAGDAAHAAIRARSCARSGRAATI